MEDLLNRLRNWNGKMNDIPRRLVLIALVLAVCFVVVKLFPLFWPFVVALLFAMMMEPLVRLLRRAFSKMRLGNKLATILGMVVLFGLIGWLLKAVSGRLIREAISLAQATPSLLRSLNIQITVWMTNLSQHYADVLPDNLTGMIESVLKEAENALTPLARTIAAGAWTTATSAPKVLLSVVLTIMGTFYLSSDRERIFAYFHRTFPKGVVRKSMLLKRDIFKALFGQVKAQLLVSLLITVVVTCGLLIQHKPYWLLLGLLIGLADALPVLGAGLFLIPWSLVGFAMGDTATGIGMALTYVSVVVARQIAEPRIVGKNLGLYPLATMMAMFAGFQLTGNVLGLLLGPILLNLCKVVLQADRGEELPTVRPRLKLPFRRKGKESAPKDANPAKPEEQ